MSLPLVGFALLALIAVALVIYGAFSVLRILLSRTEGRERRSIVKGVLLSVSGLLLAALTVWGYLAWVAAVSSLITKGQLKELVIAMHNYHGDNRGLPTQAIYSKEGKPLLSWRVSLLPFLGEDNLFKQFKLDEPWDSVHNKQLLPLMPDVYRSHRYPRVAPDLTFYRVFTGPGTIFDGNKQMTMGQLMVADGSNNTILIVEAGEPVPWTKPEELPFSPQDALPALGGPRGSVFHFVAGDGSAYSARKNLPPELLRAWITATGKELNMPIDTER